MSLKSWLKRFMPRQSPSLNGSKRQRRRVGAVRKRKMMMRTMLR